MSRSPLQRALSSQIRQALPTKARFAILDAQENVLFGKLMRGNRYPIEHNETVYGWVVGASTAQPIAVLLANIIAKDHENNQLADEALELYREINLVYNLSEKLSDTLELKATANLILGEAQRLIEANYGAVLFVDSTTDQWQLLWCGVGLDHAVSADC